MACLAACFALAPAAAQPPPDSALPSPRLWSVTPPGGRAGTTIEVSFSGVDIEEPQALLFSTPSIKAEPIVPPAPMPDPKKPASKSMTTAPITKFKVMIPATTPVGSYDVRLINKWGVSNARVFEVGDLAEVLEKEPNNEVDQAQRIDVNTTVNGSIAAPTDVDYYVFAAKKGQRVVVSCLASSIDSRLIAALELYDRAGRLLASSHHYKGTDALLDHIITDDGDYFVRVHEFTYTKGDAEHFYRLSVSTAPWIDAVYPPVVEPGKAATVTVFGRNLPAGKFDNDAVVGGRVLEKMSAVIRAPSDLLAQQRLAYSGLVPSTASLLDGFEYRVRSSTGSSNPALFTYGRAPVILDKEANDTPEKAQVIFLPCEIAGRIKKKGAHHWYVFTAKKGAIYSIEAFSERLGTPADIYFSLRNATTKQVVAEFDDNPETLSATKFLTRSEDPPRFRFVVPADGKYQLMISARDANVRAGPRQIYRINILHEQPDFRLVVMPPAEYVPDEACLFQGGQQNYTVLAYRQDGYNGEIRLTAEGLPSGVSCAPQVIGKSLKQANLVLSAAPSAVTGVWEFKVKGTAMVRDQEVVREARAAGVTWPVQPQQNIPAISRLDRSLLVAVRERAPYNLTAAIDKATLTQGEKGALSLKLTRLWPDFKTPLQAVAVDLPPNLAVNNNQPLTMAPGKDDATIPVATAPNVVPGNYSFVLRTTAQVPYNKDAAAKQKPNVNVVLPSTPVALTILPKQVASLSLATPNVTVKAGGQGEITVKLARLYDFGGEFKLQLVLPASLKGVTAPEVTVPSGKDEAKLSLKIAADAALGNRSNLVVRAIALVNGSVPTTHEAKVNLSIVK
jgi:hypothetical protein